MKVPKQTKRDKIQAQRFKRVLVGTLVFVGLTEFTHIVTSVPFETAAAFTTLFMYQARDFFMRM